MEKAKPMITDEMVEKADEAFGYPGYTADIRRAILAVLPDIVEECAKVATLWEQRGHAHAVVASEIRALASLSFQDGKK